MVSYTPPIHAEKDCLHTFNMSAEIYSSTATMYKDTGKSIL
jgi:hypothetical protein